MIEAPTKLTAPAKFGGMTCKEVGEVLGIAPTLVSRIEIAALKKIAYRMKHQGLVARDFLGDTRGTATDQGFDAIDAPEVEL